MQTQLPKARTLVPPSGMRDARSIFVLDQPDRTEIAARRLFVGQDAQRFVSCMDSAGLQKSLSYVTCAIKDQDFNAREMVYHSKKNGVTMNARAKQYMEVLKEELTSMDAEFICACGNVSFYMLTGKWGVHNWRGSFVESTLIPGKKVMGCLMPWTIRNDYKNKFLISADLKKYRDRVNGLYTETYRDIMINPTFNQAMDFLRYCRDEGLSGKEISYDIEVNNYDEKCQKFGLIPQVSCISFGVNMRSMCIPFINADGDYFPAVQELDIWTAIAIILEEPRIEKIGQNVIFDSHFLLRTYGMHVVNLQDTMIAQQTLVCDLPKGLDMITSLWTDHPYYKADGKEFFATGSNWDNFYVYNATDSAMCDEAYPKQLSQLAMTGNSETYERQRRLIEPLTFMMERGLKVDVTGMQLEYNKLGEELRVLEGRLEEICGVGFNPRSTIAVHNWFYGKKHVKPYKKRNTKGVMANCYDDTAMKRLIRRGFKEAKLIQEIKHIGKIRAGYLDVTKVDKDGRYRCAFNPVGTAFSRLASKKNIFGTGSNLQNWPKPLRRFLLIDDGYIGYAIDLSQAENRIVAYQGRVEPMILAFEEDKDVHGLTARLIMNIILGEKVANETDVRAVCHLGDGTHTWRDWGKKANHGFNYDWGYKAFALKNEMPEKDGKAVYDGYHAIYPGIQKRFHSDVKDSLKSTRTIKNLYGRSTYFVGELNDQTFKAAYSCIPQGTVGDVINECGIEEIYYDQENYKDVDMLLQIHDEIIFQIKLDDTCTFEDHARILTRILRKLEPTLTTTHGQDFVIPAELTMMKTLYASGDKKKNIPPGGKDIGRCYSERDDLPKFADLLRNSWGEINARYETKGA